MNLLFLFFGVAFGFGLSRALVTDYDTIIGMFRLATPHVLIVMGAAIAVAAAGLYFVRRRKQALIGCAIDVRTKPMHQGIVPGGLIFGVGWALSGG
jgi:LPXTG-motif cell wall-anchored protein